MSSLKNRTLLLAAVWVLASAGTHAAEGYLNIGSDAEPLRTAFNAAAGSVRVVMLVSPT